MKVEAVAIIGIDGFAAACNLASVGLALMGVKEGIVMFDVVQVGENGSYTIRTKSR